MPADLTSAARAVVRRVGLEALTLAAVAKEAGISRATLYRRISSRDELISTLVAAELNALESMVLARLRFAVDPRDTVYMLVREVLTYLASHDALHAALRIDGAIFLPWLIRTGDRPTLVDIVTERALDNLMESSVAQHLYPNPAAAIEFMVSVIYAELLSPAQRMTHDQIATYITTAVVCD